MRLRWTPELALAPLLPTLVLLAYQVAQEVGGWAPPVDAGLLWTAWAMTTLPLALLSFGFARSLRALRLAHAGIAASALEAQGRAERALADALRRLEAVELEVVRRPAPDAPAPRAWLGRLGVLLALLLVGAGIAYAVATAPAADENVHHHARLAVFVDGARVDYSDAAFDLAARGFLRGHLHAPDGATIHIEGRPGLTLGELFERTLLAELTAERLRLDALVHDGSLHPAVPGHALRVMVNHAGEDGWARVLDPPAYAPRDGDLVLVTVGPPDEDLGPQQAALALAP